MVNRNLSPDQHKNTPTRVPERKQSLRYMHWCMPLLMYMPQTGLIEVRHARVPAGPAPGPARAVMQYSHAHFLATHARPGSIWGAFERQQTVPERVRCARRSRRRHSRSRCRKLSTGRHGRRVRGRWSAEGCEARRGRAEVIQGGFGRRSVVDVRMRRERARTVRSCK